EEFHRCHRVQQRHSSAKTVRTVGSPVIKVRFGIGPFWRAAKAHGISPAISGNHPDEMIAPVAEDLSDLRRRPVIRARTGTQARGQDQTCRSEPFADGPGKHLLSAYWPGPVAGTG